MTPVASFGVLEMVLPASASADCLDLLTGFQFPFDPIGAGSHLGMSQVDAFRMM